MNLSRRAMCSDRVAIASWPMITFGGQYIPDRFDPDSLDVNGSRSAWLCFTSPFLSMPCSMMDLSQESPIHFLLLASLDLIKWM
jgi:hypothetical protein